MNYLFYGLCALAGIAVGLAIIGDQFFENADDEVNDGDYGDGGLK